MHVGVEVDGGGWLAAALAGVLVEGESFVSDAAPVGSACSVCSLLVVSSLVVCSLT